MGGCLTPPIFRNGTLVGQKLRKGRAKLLKIQSNHMDRQGNERFSISDIVKKIRVSCMFEPEFVQKKFFDL